MASHLAKGPKYCFKKRTIFRTIIALVSTFGLMPWFSFYSAPTAKAASLVYNEDFSTTDKQDTTVYPPANPDTADWNTTEGLLAPKPGSAGFYKLDGITPGASNTTGTHDSSFIGQDSTLVTDSQGMPWLVTAEAYPPATGDLDIWVMHWDGSKWLDVAGNDYDSGAVCPPLPNCAYGAKVTVLDTAGDSSRAVMALDSSDQPQVAWQEDSNIYFAKWNGTDWVNAAGTTTLADYNVTSGASWHGFTSFQRPALHVRSDGQPALVFMGKDSGNSDIVYTYWDSGLNTWVNAAGTTTDTNYDITQTTFGFYSRHPVFALTPSNEPIVAWSAGSGQPPNASEIYVAKWNGSIWADPTGTTAWASAGGLSNPSSGSGLANGPASIALSSTGLIGITWAGDVVGTYWWDCALTTDCNAFYAQLDPAATSPTWNGPDGSTFTGTAFSPSTDVGEWFPTLRFNAQNQPLVFYGRQKPGGPGGYSEAPATLWNGSAWVELGNAIANVPNAYINPSSIGFDNQGGFWVDASVLIGGTEHYVSHWIDPYAGRTNGFYDLAHAIKDTGTNIANSGTTTKASKHSVAIDGANYPHVVWQQNISGADDIFYAHWDGSKWLSYKNTTTVSDFNISGSTAASSDAVIAIGDNGYINIAWSENISGNTEIMQIKTSNKYGTLNAQNSTLYTVGCLNTASCPATTNVSNTAGSSVTPDLLDYGSSALPQITWIDGTGANDEVFVTRWSGSAWVKPSGGAGADDISSGLVTPHWGGSGCSVVRYDAANADIAVDPSNHLGVAWQLPWDRVGCVDPLENGSFSYVLYREFISAWQGMGSTNDCLTGVMCTIFDGDGTGPSVEFKTNDRIAIVYQAWPVVSNQWGWQKDTIFAQFDGVNCPKENVSSTVTNSLEPNLEFDADQNPVVWWNDAGNEQIVTGHFSRKLSSGGWVGLDRTNHTGESYRNEDTRAGFELPLVAAALDSNGNPFVVYNGTSPTDPFIAHWYMPGASAWRMQSLAVDSTDSNIARATLTKVDDTAGQTIIYKLSNNGGLNFYAVTPGVAFNFPSKGSDLRWRIELVNGQNIIDTGPTVDSLNISYETPEVIIAQSGGSTNVVEGGATDSLSVVLANEPQQNVKVALGPDAQTSLGTTLMTFTPANWSTPQSVIVTAVDDTVVENTHSSTISIGSTSSDVHYDGITQTIQANVADNDTETGGTGPGPTPPPAPPPPTSSQRIEGADATDLSINVAKTLFNNNAADGAVIASDISLIDAFVGGPFAARINGPILLNDPSTLEQPVIDGLNRVLKDKNKTIFLLGGEKALAHTIDSALRNSGYENLERFAGINRRQTAALIADATASRNPSTELVYLSEDTQMVDAFAATAYAANVGTDNKVQPIVLTKRANKSLDGYTQSFLMTHTGTTRVDIMGGTKAVPAEIERQLRAIGHISNINRFAGNNRYATAALFSQQMFAVPETVTIANGESDAAKPGALLAGLVAARNNGPLVLTRANDLPSETVNYLHTNAASLHHAIIVGSAAQVSQAVMDYVTGLI
ncbi:MAG: cell wall-binding repeat-containing protein [Parcubacteria group bacterium]